MDIQKIINYDSLDERNSEWLRARRLYLNDEIDDCTVEPIVRAILQYNEEDKGLQVKDRKPIILYCTSNGGSVTDGFSVINIIETSKTPVYTVNLAYQYSMGFLIGLVGHKRYAMPDATFLMHDGTNVVWDSAAKCKDQLEFQEKMAQRIKRLVLSHSNITEKQYDENYRKEWYTYPEEAKALGFTDYIIGEDCDIDEIL